MCWHQVLRKDRLEPSWNALSLAGCQSTAWSSADPRAGSVGAWLGEQCWASTARLKIQRPNLYPSPRDRFHSLLPIVSHRGLFFLGCGGIGKEQGTSGTCLEKEMHRASGKELPQKELALLTSTHSLQNVIRKSQPAFLSFIHLAMVSTLAVVYKLNKLKTVWKRSLLNLACPKTNRSGGRQGHTYPRPAQKHPYLSSLSCFKCYLLQDTLKLSSFKFSGDCRWWRNPDTLPAASFG